MVVNKYISERGIESLYKNYDLFSENFHAFLTNTISLHPGNTRSGWRSFYYLLPLFLYLKIAGGLSLQNLYFFNFIISAVTVILFYKLCDRHFGREVANFSTLLVVFSSWFSEFAMSISYHTFTIMIAAILITLMFDCLNNAKLSTYLFLGIVSGLSLYYYGPIRFLLPVVLILLFYKNKYPYKSRIYFCAGFFLLLIPSLLGNYDDIRLFDRENIYFYTEPGFEKPFFLRWVDNLRIYASILSGRQIDPLHAALINKILVIPLMIGTLAVLKKWKDKSYRLLLMIAVAITLLPVFTTFAHWQPRRFALYVIPIYMFIGIGLYYIIRYISSIKRKVLKVALYSFIVSMLVYIIAHEMLYVRVNIYTPKRDIGFIDLGLKISKSFVRGPLFYLRETPYRLCEADGGAYLLMLVLKNTKSDYKITQISNLADIEIQDEVYIIKSPFISEKVFKPDFDRF